MVCVDCSRQCVEHPSGACSTCRFVAHVDGYDFQQMGSFTDASTAASPYGSVNDQQGETK